MARTKAKTKAKPEPTPESAIIENRPPGTESWLRSAVYAKKYNIILATLHFWRSKGFLECKPFTGRYGKGYLYPDIPPQDHPNFINKQPAPEARTATDSRRVLKDSRLSTKDKERRKKILEPFLEVFLRDAKPDKMFFTGPDIQQLLKIGNARLYRTWRDWGLEAYPMPKGRTGEKVYSRASLYKFLSGKWDPPEDGKKTTDEKVLGSALGGPTSKTDGYYHYDLTRVYPMSGEGFMRWLDDKKVMLQNKQLRKWVPFIPLGFQREFFLEALRQDKNGKYLYNLIIACWERGEGKTLCIALIVIFRFFNGFEEVINLASESKDLASFIHYNLIKKIILNTQALKNTQGLEVKEKEIVLMRAKNDPCCIMKAVPSSSGLLPGTTVAVFTELHKIKNRDFFIDFWTSTRATPNAMTLVDTTVAKKGHIVQSLWESYCNKEDPLLYFNHKADDIQNPETTTAQLNSFRRHMLPHEFNMYFRNRWEDAAGGMFSNIAIKQIEYAGIVVGGNPIYGVSNELYTAVGELFELESKRSMLRQQNVEDANLDSLIDSKKSRLIRMDDIYKIPAGPEDISRLEALFGINFMIGVGLDRSKLLGDVPDRTVFSCIARGVVDENTSYRFVLDVFIPQKATFHFLQDKLMEWQERYGWITKVTAEDYQAQDFQLWCVEHGIDAELLAASFKNQELIFTNLYQQVTEGYFKSPTLPFYTDDDGKLHDGYSNKPDILREELNVFTGDLDRKFFGSPEKRKKGATKDDVIYSLAWASYACEGENIADLHAMAKQKTTLSMVSVNTDVIGDYGL